MEGLASRLAIVYAKLRTMRRSVGLVLLTEIGIVYVFAKAGQWRGWWVAGGLIGSGPRRRDAQIGECHAERQRINRQ